MSEKIQKYRFLSKFLPYSTVKKLVVITGARQTGKTTLAKAKYPDLRYINLDSPENREIARSIMSASWSRDIGNAVIDEAQKEAVVFEKIKYAYDDGGISFSVMLGSSHILLLKKIRESLAGRVSMYELWPLLMRELRYDSSAEEAFIKAPLIDMLFSRGDIDKIFSGVPAFLTDREDAGCRDAENHILKWGGMPALLHIPDDNERWKWLKDYEYTYLERDLGDLARLSDLEPFRKFQKLSALRSGKLLNYSELARDASVSVDTAKRYLEYLRLSYQVMLIQPYYKNITSSVVKTPKLYWVDVGLLRQLCGYREGVSGEIYETMVVAELCKWIKTTPSPVAQVYFYRTRSGMELDILLETEGGVIGMEIKSRPTISPGDITVMREIAGRLGSAWRGGLVIYTGNEIKKIQEPAIWAVPSRRLFAG